MLGPGLLPSRCRVLYAAVAKQVLVCRARTIKAALAGSVFSQQQKVRLMCFYLQ